ncbi:hypothetical protein F7P69_27520 [Cellulosimicrobium funkei]|nr:hypothetical protein [Cellulosimicrobium funkei]
MKQDSRPRRSTLARAASLPVLVGMLAGVLAGSLSGCSSAGREATIPGPANTVHVDPGTHTVAAAQVEAGEAYAPFLTWKDRDTVAVTTFGTSTTACLPVVVGDTVDADGAYRALVDLGGAAGRSCTADWTAQEWDLPVPADLAPAAVIRLQLDGEPDTAYEYPMGDSRPG